jgi:SAM-dependent MidA family methyltransferase
VSGTLQSQKQFLTENGIQELLADCHALPQDTFQALKKGVRRLVEPEAMGNLFKVLTCVASL